MKKTAILVMVLSFAPAQLAHAADDDLDAYFDGWSARAHAAMAQQPHWAPTLMTASPRLTQVMRYDQYWETNGAGSSVDVSDAGKGFEFIPLDTTSFTVDLPPYENRSRRSAAEGWGDWPALFIKQRLISAPEGSGDYILTGYLTIQAPLGAAAFTNHAWLITPGLGFGKGWGDLDLQGQIGAAIPTAHAAQIGTAFTGNLALQYHYLDFFWPEIELNGTSWSGGPRAGLNQLFMTTGLVMGPVPVFENYLLSIGGGHQFALAPSPLVGNPLTPAYDHNWILTVRIIY